MNKIINILLNLTILCTINALDEAKQKTEDEIWTSYKKIFCKNFLNLTEEAKSRELWCSRKQLIDEHNKRADEGLETYRLGKNSFMDYVR